MKSKFIVMTASPALSGKARKYGMGYRKIALVEVNDDILKGKNPKMISDRAIGVIKIHDCASLYYGKGIKSEGGRFYRECKEKAEKLNKVENSPVSP